MERDGKDWNAKVDRELEREKETIINKNVEDRGREWKRGIQSGSERN